MNTPDSNNITFAYLALSGTMDRRYLCVSLFCWFLLAQTRTVVAEDTKLYLLTIFPYPTAGPSEQPSWNQGRNILPAAQLAVSMINERDDVLEGYALELINDDGGCDIADRARISLVRRIIAERGHRAVVGIIGPGCSTSSLAVSVHTSHPEIALLNLHLAGSPLLEDRSQFGYAVGLLGTSYAFVHAAAALMSEGNWTRIAVLYDDERVFFLSTYQALERDLQKYVPNASIAYTSAVYDTYFPLSDIVALDIRVIIVLTGLEFAHKIMCLASYNEITYPRYQWVWMNRNVSEFNDTLLFAYDSREYVCSYENLQSALYNSIFVNYVLQRHDEELTKAHITYQQYWDMYNHLVELYNNNQSMYEAPGDPSAVVQTNVYATLVFDAIWAIALTLSKVEPFVNLTAYGLGLGQTEESDIIRDILYNNEFQGISGPIHFNASSGYTERTIEVGQGLTKNGYQLIGYIEGENFKFNVVSTPVLVPGEFQERRLEVVNSGIAAFFSIITLLITSLTVIAHVFTTVNHMHPSVKAQSPKLNQISYCGAYLFSVGTLLSIVYKAVTLEPDTYGAFCQAIWAWFFSISFSVFFAPICARTWRLYRIFTHYLNPGPLISDQVLLSFIGVCVSFDILLATVWTILDPFRGEEYRDDISVSGDYSSRLGCYCEHTAIWFSAVYLLKITLLLATVLLSVLTRDISNEKFKTSYVRVFVYLFALTWINGLLLYYFLSYQGLDIHVDYIVLAVMCNALLFFALIVFVPPIYPLVKEKVPTSLKTVKYHMSLPGITNSLEPSSPANSDVPLRFDQTNCDF